METDIYDYAAPRLPLPVPVIPQRVPSRRVEPVSAEVVCAMANRWGVDTRLILGVVNAASTLPYDVWIFSGSRSREHQEEISETPFDRSTHAEEGANGCPRLATGLDVQPVSPGVRLSLPDVAQMGAAMVLQGLRWGGGAPFDDTGFPVGNERWHVDLGPRPT